MRGESCAGQRRIGDENPDKTVVLFAGIIASIDALDFQILIGGEGRDELALAVVDVELPAMVAALEILSVETTAIERHTAMGAGVTQSEGLSEAIASDNQGDLQEGRLVQLVAMDVIGGESAIPEAGEHERVWDLALRQFLFRHEDCELLISSF